MKDVVVEYQGDKTTIGKMLAELKKGRASYWYWHTLFTMFELKYREIRAKKRYGILLTELPIIGKTYLLELRIAQGGYDKSILEQLIKMYAVLLEESISTTETAKCGICGKEFEETQTVNTIMYTDDLPPFHTCDICKKK